MGSAASAQSDHLLAGELEKPLDACDLSNESAKAEVSVAWAWWVEFERCYYRTLGLFSNR